MPSLPSTFLSQSHLVDVVHDSSCSQSQGSPTIKHIGPDRPRSATEQNRAECRTSWSYGLRPRYWYPYFQWISNDYTFISHISKNGMFSGRLEGNCQEFSEKTIYFLWDSMAFIGIQWPFQCHFWLIGDGWFTTTTHCSSSDEPLGSAAQPDTAVRLGQRCHPCNSCQIWGHPVGTLGHHQLLDLTMKMMGL